MNLFNGVVKIILSNYWQFKNKGLIEYKCQLKDSRDKTHNVSVKTWYETDSIQSYIRDNGTEWSITGELKENWYKDKEGKWISTGLYLDVEELGYMEVTKNE